MNSECNIIGPMCLNTNVNKNLFTVFVDGGMQYSKGFTNFVSVGDSDSYNQNHDYQLNKDKDRSDFFHGLELIPIDCLNLNASGFLGGRYDHFLMNLGEIDTFLRQRSINVNLYLESKLKIIATSQREIEFFLVGLFSIFSFEERLLQISGDCKYKSKKEYTKLTPRSSHGLSNIANGNVKIITDGPIFIFYNNDV